MLVQWFYFEDAKAAVFGKGGIVATVNATLVYAAGIGYYQAAIAFLRVYGVSYVAAIIADEPFANGFPAIIYRMV